LERKRMAVGQRTEGYQPSPLTPVGGGPRPGEHGVGQVRFLSEFALGDRVYIDKDGSLIGVVTAVQFRTTVSTVEVSYIHNGDAKTVWVEAWRCEKVE